MLALAEEAAEEAAAATEDSVPPQPEDPVPPVEEEEAITKLIRTFTNQTDAMDTVVLTCEDANEDEWEQNLTRMGNRIQRLGAINLAAIDEFKVQSERKQYLDAQNEDLEKALATLENAIRKIDIETRTKFKETFDKVNSKLQQRFSETLRRRSCVLGDDWWRPAGYWCWHHGPPTR